MMMNSVFSGFHIIHPLLNMSKTLSRNWNHSSYGQVLDIFGCHQVGDIKTGNDVTGGIQGERYSPQARTHGLHHREVGRHLKSY